MQSSGNGALEMKISFGPLCCGVCGCPEEKRAVHAWSRDGEVGTELCSCICHVRVPSSQTFTIDSIGLWPGAHVVGFDFGHATFEPTFTRAVKNRGPPPKKNRRGWLRR